MTQKSKIFSTKIYKKLEKKIKDVLDGQTNVLSARTIDSPRAVGDAIEHILAENFEMILGDASKEYSSQFARRAMLTWLSPTKMIVTTS